MNNLFNDLMISWLTKDGIHATETLLQWINHQNEKIEVEIKKVYLEESNFWFYDANIGMIRNKNNSFFTISGIQQYKNDKLLLEQPIIIQDEIGFLGIITKKIDGIIHFLMQAKIEPGNINNVQISPTIQATKSNFMQSHGGRKPDFIEYFIESKPNQIVVDQIQSEQSSRFFKKRNRNVILLLDEDIKELSTHRWMTLGQIKELMNYDNLVNMDTRTVISCIPFSLMDKEKDVLKEIENKCTDKSLLNSIIGIESRPIVSEIYNTLNNYRMFGETYTKLVDLYALKNWNMRDREFIYKYPFPFSIIFCDISIEGREVTNWNQPLFQAQGIATFGLISYNHDGIKKFLVRAMPEIGCFDGIELGPTIQDEVNNERNEDEISILFYKKLVSKEDIICEVLLSEEGGRFYHEQNRNIIIEIDKAEIPLNLPSGYFWSDYKTLNILMQVNNCLNIQLRNLLSLLEV